MGEPGSDPIDATGIASTPFSGVGRGPPGQKGDGERLGTVMGAQEVVPGDGERLGT
jgi:hypothetical protein